MSTANKIPEMLVKQRFEEQVNWRQYLIEISVNLFRVERHSDARDTFLQTISDLKGPCLEGIALLAREKES